MKMVYIVFTILFFSCLSAWANSPKWIIKTNNSRLEASLIADNCSYEILNPNLGGDILSVQCDSLKKIIRNILSSPDVLRAEVDQTWKMFSEFSDLSDPEIQNQWALDFINVRSFWRDHSIGDSKVKIAIIDSGIDYRHEDLSANIALNNQEIAGNEIDDDKNGYVDDVYGWNSFDKTNDPMADFDLVHGTHVAGVIGAVANNEIGMAGLNWKTAIIPIKLFGPKGEATIEGAIRSFDYAVARGAKIINASWGGVKESALLQEVVKKCQDKGILIVAAAGNEGKDNDLAPTYPANYPFDNIISVASINLHNQLSGFSNWGANTVHVAAPGESILSTTNGNRYGYKDGTSMAVPHITGIAALLWALHPEWTYKVVRNHILNSCVPLASLKDKVSCQGYFKF